MLIDIQNTLFTQNEKAVIFIEKMIFPENEIIFILGSSGVGKTTILEAIGLMNKNFEPSGDKDHSWIRINDGGSDLLSYSDIWKNDTMLSEIRQGQCSFIFQESYLMKNLKIKNQIKIPYEISKYVENGRDIKELKDAETINKMIKKYLKKMKLDSGILNRKPEKLSVGQKQRVSFIQALSKKFRLLFADEPTGNLDYVNSKTLMKLLKKTTRKNKASAVIVSHNVELAKKYADRIFVLSLVRDKKTDKIIGQFKKEHEFFRTNENMWNSNLKKDIYDIYRSDIKIIKQNSNDKVAFSK